MPAVKRKHTRRRTPQRNQPPHRAGPLSGKRVPRGNPAVGFILMVAEDHPDDLRLLAELGDSFPNITQGHGGFEEIQRIGRVSLTSFRGFPLLGVDVELFFDNWDQNQSIEHSLSILDALAGRGPLRKSSQPEKLLVNASGVMPYDAWTQPGRRWVINGIDFDDESAIRNDSGNRIRQSVTVSFLQFNRDTGLQDRALAARRQLRGRNSARKKYKVKKGDTLVSIARKQLHNAAKWDDIARLNGLRDPRAKHELKPGRVLKLP